MLTPHRFAAALARMFGGGQPQQPTVPFPLDQLLSEQISNHFDPIRNLTDLIVQKFTEQGVRVSKRQRRRIEQALEQALQTESNEVTYELRSWKWWSKHSVHFEVTEEDTEAMLRRLDVSPEKPLEEFMAEVEDSVPDVLSSFRRSYRDWLRGRSRLADRLEARIAAQWREPFESLGLMIALADHIGDIVGRHYTQHAPEDPRLIYVLTRLHARGILIAREILTLLRTGYPDAAMARWRSLHEVEVVASIILEHGNNCAERYVDHNAVAGFKAAKQYQNAAERLKYPPLTDEEFAKLRAGHEAAIGKYGEAFGGDYGWAADALKTQKSPRFVDLESAAGRGHLRPFYGVASENVHAGPRNLLGKLGSVNEDLLLLGPSPYGMADPGQNAALTLGLLIAIRMSLCPVLDTVLIGHVAGQLAEETAAQFVATQEALEGGKRGEGVAQEGA